MTLDDERQAIRAAARRFAEAELAPHADRWDEAGDCPPQVLQSLAGLGFMGLTIPTAYGGSGGGHLLKALVVEEIAAGCAGVSTILHVHDGSCTAIADLGTPAQKDHWLPRMARGETIGCFCITEPDAGSDTSMVRTRASRVDGGWQLDGTKQFISNGRRAGVAVVVAVTDPAAGKRGFTLFLVPTDTPGLRVGRVEKKMGQKCADTTEIILERCVVPDSAVLGTVGGGYAYAMGSLAEGRVAIAAQAVGMARSAYAHAVQYAGQRKAYGQEIIRHQAVGFRLANMLMQIELARQYTWHAATLLDEGHTAMREAAIAKCFAAEMSERVCSDAIATLGGYGYIQGPVERIYRDARVCQIYEGTGDIQRLIIARDLALHD
ncbi:acyl-CoA dehydrogenase family protein [Pseudorhodoferax sp.]|uniref:acyl-CoA dehydrogenase family protein n=1 Tax=Pseudorhodoferax sp. TaxID=1993553 RepID=UPI002DD63845|nr:acyl-CoA dehydrogenase family protein [Pseudorhodoferax sp.]